jgi:uncharacterized protein (TIGR03437 family)
VQIAGTEARVVFVGQTAIPGLYQVNVQVPRMLQWDRAPYAEFQWGRE